MKKISIALAMFGFIYCSSQAQEITEVCNKTSNGNISCYKSKFAQNYRVYKTGCGYTIYGATPNEDNTTYPKLPVLAKGLAGETDYENGEYTDSRESVPRCESPNGFNDNMPANYAGNDNSKSGGIRYCYWDDEVVEVNANPYNTCPNPRYYVNERKIRSK